MPGVALTRLGIVGTEGGIGKTVVASAIITAMREAGARVAPMKPIGTVDATEINRLQAACGFPYPAQLVQPYVFDDSAVPLVAARRARSRIDCGILDRAFAELCTLSDAIVVEDSGGLLVPITESENFATLFVRWGLSLVIVARNRAGAVNQVLSTCSIAQSHGLKTRAVVLTNQSRERGGTAERTNLALLKELLLTVPVVAVPFTTTPDDPRTIAALARELAAHPTIARPA